MAGLDPNEVKRLYANRRQKGLYTQLLSELIGSGENGANVKENWPQLAEKPASTLKQGFENAKQKKDAPEGSENIDVIVDGENVFLINTATFGEDGSETEAEPEAAVAP
jgi:hypothetical protein